MLCVYYSTCFGLIYPLLFFICVWLFTLFYKCVSWLSSLAMTTYSVLEMIDHFQVTYVFVRSISLSRNSSNSMRFVSFCAHKHSHLISKYKFFTITLTCGNSIRNAYANCRTSICRFSRENNKIISIESTLIKLFILTVFQWSTKKQSFKIIFCQNISRIFYVLVHLGKFGR